MALSMDGNEMDLNLEEQSESQKKEAAVKTVDFDSMLKHVGGFGRFQIQLFLYLCPVCFCLAFTYLSQTFITLTPDHWCRNAELDNSSMTLEEQKNISLPKELRNNVLEYSQCRIYDVNYSQVLAEGLRPNESWPVSDCTQGWDYDFTDLYPTITSDYNWVCDDKWKSTFAQTIFFVGSVIGTFLFGFLSDRFGRLPVVVLTHLVAALGSLASTFSVDLVSFSIFRFTVGLTFDSTVMVIFILVLEFVAPRHRMWVSTVPFALTFMTGSAAIPWIARAIRNWRYFCICTSVPIFFILVYYKLLPESSRWLLQAGKMDRVVDELRQIAAVNRRNVDDAIFLQFKNAVKEAPEKEQKVPTIGDVIRRPRLRNRIMLGMSIMFALYLVFDGHARTTDYPIDLYMAMTLSAFTELPGDLLSIVGSETVGRRLTAIVFFLVVAIIDVAAGILSQGEYNPAVVSALVIVGRFSATTAINAVVLQTMEITPTVIRGQASSLMHICGHLGAMVSPNVIYLKHFGRGLPMIVWAVVSLYAAAIELFLPETHNESLPDTLEDGEQFLADHKWYRFKCDIKFFRKGKIQTRRKEISGLDNPAMLNVE